MSTDQIIGLSFFGGIAILAALIFWRVDRAVVRDVARGVIQRKIDGLIYQINRLDQNELRYLEGSENDIAAMTGDGDATHAEYVEIHRKIDEVNGQIRELKVQRWLLEDVLRELPR